MIRTDEVFKALADPTRRRILRLLNDGEMSAGELADYFQISGPSMSHHFNILKQADLIQARRERQQIFYSVNTTVFQDMIATVLDLFSGDNTHNPEGEPKRASGDRPGKA